ncbi:uncharacterized protein [Miscanthus floridulus]|uniref:uncharacterized protein isoform X2 n=1 Tax=Miscanthus floridulus TaxID=154761 RepID=UPI0034588058
MESSVPCSGDLHMDGLVRLHASAATSSAPRTRQRRASSHPADTSGLFSLRRDSLQLDSSLPLLLAHRAPQRTAPSDEPGGSCPPVQPDRLLRLGPSTAAPPRSRAWRRLFHQQPASPTHVQSSDPSSRVGGSLRSGSSPQQNAASRVRRRTSTSYVIRSSDPTASRQKRRRLL